MRKTILAFIFLFLSICLYAGDSDESFCKIERRVNNYLSALTESFNDKLDVANYYHPQSFFPAPEEYVIWLIDDFEVKTIRQVDINTYGYYLFDLSSDKVFEVEVSFHVIDEIRNDVSKEKDEANSVFYIWGELNDLYYILEIENYPQEIFSFDEYQDYQKVQRKQ